MSDVGASPTPDRFAALLASFREGRRASLARVISMVEDERPRFELLLHELYPLSGRAQRIGITGPPGAGKSTLSAALISAYRARGEKVGVLAVDPTSPFTGGALLGDRIRMNDVGLDEGVFIRSMATRGSLGGLAVTTREVADVMDAFGFDRILIETVGVGQSELDIAGTADTTVVVLVPESGDSVQALKAGLMEIADLFVVNKADRPGALRLARDIEMMLHLREPAALRGLSAGHHGAMALVRPGGQTADTGTRRHGDAESLTTDTGTRRHGDAASGLPSAPGGAADAASAADTAAPEAAATPRRRVPEAAGQGESISGSAEEAAPANPQSWAIPVLQAVAAENKGVTELLEALDRHREWSLHSGALARKRRERLDRRVREAVMRRLAVGIWRERAGDEVLEAAMPALERGDSTPYEVAARIVRDFLG